MIRLLEGALPPYLYERKTVYAIRMCTMHCTWANVPADLGAPQFYEMDTGCAVMVLGEICTLDGDVFDEEEFAHFLEMSKCTLLLCSTQAAERLELELLGTREAHPILCYNGPAPSIDPQVVFSPALPAVFSLLGVVFDNMTTVNCQDWVADVELRQRRGLSSVVGIMEGEALISTAGIYHQNKEAVLIGSVGTLPDWRGRGYATLLVQALMAKTARAGKASLLIAKTPYAAALYEHMGFVRVGKQYHIDL